MGFPTSHQSRLCLTHNFPKMGFRYLNLSFFCRNFDQPLKVCYKVSLSKNFQRKSRSAINHLSNGIHNFAEDDPVPIKFGPKGTDPQHEGCMFHISHAACSAVSDSRPSGWSFTGARYTTCIPWLGLHPLPADIVWFTSLWLKLQIHIRSE